MTAKVASDGAGVDLLGRGVAYLLVGEASRAERLLRRAVRLAPGLAVAHAYLGAALLAQGKKRAARRFLEQAVRLDPANFVVRTQRAKYFLGEGAYREAFIELAVALWKAPDPGARVQVYGLLRQILRVQAGLWEGAGADGPYADAGAHRPRR